MKWAGDTLVARDGSLFTVRGCTLEIRGNGWDRRRRRGETENSDLARVCHLDSEAQARRIAEIVADAAGSEGLSSRVSGPTRSATAQGCNDQAQPPR